MSRSRKKVLGFVDRNPFMKTYANRRIRRLKPEALEHAFGAGKSNRTIYAITKMYTSVRTKSDIC